MTRQEYNKLNIGDKFKIKENGRIVTLGTIEKSPCFKFESGGKDGFMIGNIWYPYQWCELKNEKE